MLAATALLLGLSGSAVANEETIEWGSVGNWGIFVDKTLGNSCYLTTAYVDGTFFRLGFTERDAKFPMYVGIGNRDWQSLEIGKDYDVQLQLDNLNIWNAPASAGSIGGIPFLFVNTDQVQFVDEFMRRHTLRVHFGGREILRLNLQGSNAAAVEMLRCQNAVVNHLPPAPKNDPFSGVSSPSKRNDPFSY